MFLRRKRKVTVEDLQQMYCQAICQSEFAYPLIMYTDSDFIIKTEHSTKKNSCKIAIEPCERKDLFEKIKNINKKNNSNFTLTKETLGNSKLCLIQIRHIEERQFPPLIMALRLDVHQKQLKRFQETLKNSSQLHFDTHFNA